VGWEFTSVGHPLAHNHAQQNIARGLKESKQTPNKESSIEDQNYHTSQSAE
jgi:hypothetical protein